MSVETMREIIREVYKSDTWRYKVSQMSNNQVIAVYFSFVRRGLIK